MWFIDKIYAWKLLLYLNDLMNDGFVLGPGN